MSFPFRSHALEPGYYEPEGLYLHTPFVGSFIITQFFGENPEFYGRFTYDGVPLRGHNGIDFATPTGTAILAADTGSVIYIGYEAGGFGLYIKLLHAWGESLYAHLGQTQVETGQQVTRGAIMGVTNNSGASLGPHLHFGLRIRPYTRTDGWGGFADPLPYLDPMDLRRLEQIRTVQQKTVLPPTPMVMESPGLRRP